MATDFTKLTESPGEMKRRPNDGANYFDGEQIVSHLNYALTPAGWDWLPLDHGMDAEADEVWVLGQLTARFAVAAPDGEGVVTLTTVKVERGWQKINRLRADNSYKSLGDDYKAADTDALKRCARLLGVGLDAWAKGGQVSQPAQQRQQSQDRPTPTPRPRNQPQATEIPLADRPTLLARYGEMLEHAQQLGHRASWVGQDTDKLSPAQLQRYADLLGTFIARHQTAEGAA
jgi:hypothetical protein